MIANVLTHKKSRSSLQIKTYIDTTHYITYVIIIKKKPKQNAIIKKKKKIKNTTKDDFFFSQKEIFFYLPFFHTGDDASYLFFVKLPPFEFSWFFEGFREQLTQFLSCSFNS